MKGANDPQPNAAKTARLLSVIELFRAEIDPDLSIATAGVFLFVAGRAENRARTGPNISEIGQALGMDIPKVSRAVRVLSEGHPRSAKTTQGAGLLESFVDPMDVRSRRVRLTARGKQFLHRAQLAIS